ncbi:glycosyl hydrolase [Schleiferilactobacillus perolens]|jgi:hypothetical protein|uniref:glycosyl hydrolase n=1 Tax=Schleiferilactobacillus perolens TaxID=100468 RepID=UPI0023549B5E|nr:glycosyl hydrolase [Schleiferilactobacillus perolens]MCI2171017.1 glycosyl hydrolase [Schleiferilactobacillus perolens]
MRKGATVAVIGATVLLAACQSGHTHTSSRSAVQLPRTAYSANQRDQSLAAARTRLIAFLQQQLVRPDGVYTNYLDTNRNAATASGHEYLSESAGLWLLHLAYTRQFDAFRRFYQQIKDTLWQGRQFAYRYNPANHQRFPVNATVDDLRILQAVGQAAIQTKSDQWHHEYQWIAKKVRDQSIAADRPVDFVDAKTGKRAKTITLCYLDLTTLRAIGGQALYRSQLNRIQSGQLQSRLPLFATRYDYSAKKYTGTSQINSVESLLTAVHLASVNKVPPKTVQWVKKQVAAGTLANRYDGTSGAPLTFDQSAGGYALAAQLGVLTHDPDLAKQALHRALAFQIQKPGTPLNGALGDLASQQVYSFDNLETLVALDMYLGK